MTACGSDAGSTDAGSAPTDARADAMACELEDLVAELVGDVVATDCGVLPTGSELGELQAAHDCVLQAQVMDQPYTVIFSPQGIDSIIRYAYVGLPGATGLDELYFYYDSDPSGGGMSGAVAGGVSCGAVVERDPAQCGTSWEYEVYLCFLCQDPGENVASCY